MNGAGSRRIVSNEPADISAGQLERNLAFLRIHYDSFPAPEAKGYHFAFA